MKTLSLFILALFGLCSAVSNAQTTYTIGTSFCSTALVSCYEVPLLNATGQPAGDIAGGIWIDAEPYGDPTSSRFIEGIPEFSGGWAEINLDSTYVETSTSYTFVCSGKTFRATVPMAISGTLSQVVVNPNNTTSPGPLTGTFNVQFGGYYGSCYRGVSVHYKVLSGAVMVND